MRSSAAPSAEEHRPPYVRQWLQAGQPDVAMLEQIPTVREFRAAAVQVIQLRPDLIPNVLQVACQRFTNQQGGNRLIWQVSQVEHLHERGKLDNQTLRRAMRSHAPTIKPVLRR